MFELAVKRLLFVCTGNGGRSPMAQFLLERMVKSHPDRSIRRLVVDSAGISAGFQPDKELIPALRQLGISGVKHTPKQVTAELVKGVDLVLSMTEQQKRAVQKISPGAANRVYLLREFVAQKGDIVDIFGQGVPAYVKLGKELESLIEPLLEKLASAPPV